MALHFIIYYFYITWHLFRRPNSSVSVFLCEKKGEIGANASKYSSEKWKQAYISGVEVKTRMLLLQQHSEVTDPSKQHPPNSVHKSEVKPIDTVDVHMIMLSDFTKD